MTTPRPMDTLEQTRHAQDSLVVLWALVGATGLAFSGWMIAAPMIGCLGLPIALLSALAFAVAVLILGRMEVPMWRTIAGIVLAFAGLALFFHAYLEGLGAVAEHFLGRPGALRELWRASVFLLGGTCTLAASVAMRRREGTWPVRAIALITMSTAPLAWGGLALAALMGLPLGA